MASAHISATSLERVNKLPGMLMDLSDKIPFLGRMQNFLARMGMEAGYQLMNPMNSMAQRVLGPRFTRTGEQIASDSQLGELGQSPRS